MDTPVLADHELIRTLARIGALDPEHLEPFFPRVRDRDDVAVLRDPVSGVIVLDRIDHAQAQYYEQRVETGAYLVHGEQLKTPRLPDDVRRAEAFAATVRGRRWLDFGCGLGGALDALAGEAAWATGLDLSRERQAIVRAKGHHAVASLSDIEPASLDVATLFHVLEHIPNPVEVLQQIRARLKPGGTLVVEVPHARDALITLYDCEAFKRFTFWSEHLVLHTAASLGAVLASAGFEAGPVQRVQRYSLANHQYWLRHGKPGGHAKWPELEDPALVAAYAQSLAAMDRTDTLVAVVRPAG
jgi:2-polyprenyl-3-methyl-5-hydroxy-6-metoxy-1,4-benzoquinol methylase